MSDYGDSQLYLGPGDSLNYADAHTEVDEIHDGELEMYEGRASEYDLVRIAKSRLSMHLAVDRSYSLDIVATALSRSAR